MRIEQLIYLADIAQTGSITTTAQRVFLSQQAVSESIRSLERELGYQLLNRTKTGVTLTKRGQITAEYAQNIVHSYHSLLAELEQVEESAPFVGQLSVASSPMVTSTIIPGVQEYITKYHPDFTLNMCNCSNDTVIKHITEQTAELGFFYYTSAERRQLDIIKEQFPALIIKKLSSNKLVYCTRKDSSQHFLKESKFMNDENQLVIFFSADYATTNKQIFQWMSDAHSLRDSFLVSDDITLIQDLILRYDAICAMPELTYRLFFNSRDYNAVPFAEEITDDLYCIYNSNDYESHYDIIISAFEREIRHIQQKNLLY